MKKYKMFRSIFNQGSARLGVLKTINTTERNLRPKQV